MSNTNNTNRGLIIAVSSILLLIIAIFVLNGNREYVKSKLGDLKLIPIPEKFTELYFEDHNLLPKRSVAGEEAKFAFTIHNFEGATTTYPYKVYFEYPSGARVLFEDGIVRLPHDGYRTVYVSRTFVTSDLNGKVVVELTSLEQQIDFLLPNNN